MKADNTKALVLLSGGLDSAVCFFQAIQEYDEVVALSFDYGQRHRKELDVARLFVSCAEHYKQRKYEHVILEVDFPKGRFVQSALTSSIPLKAKGGYKNLPTSFVPGRNLLFLSYACTEAMVRGIDDVIIGVNVQDYSGYPDCRSEFIKSFDMTFYEATKSFVKVLTPLMYMSKAEIFAVHACDPEIFRLLVRHSLSCYNGNYKTEHAWGKGCGKCPSCKIRAKGWKEFVRDGKRAIKSR